MSVDAFTVRSLLVSLFFFSSTFEDRPHKIERRRGSCWSICCVLATMACDRSLVLSRRWLIALSVLLGLSLASSFAREHHQQSSSSGGRSQGAFRASFANPHQLPKARMTPRNGISTSISIGRGGSQLYSTPAFFATLDGFWKAHPLVAAAVVCATKASAADLVAQKRQQSIGDSVGDDDKQKWDLRRTFSFMLYGAVYQGIVQELIYNNLYNYLFGTSTSMRVAIKKVLFDAIFHNALVCIPMAYVVKSVVFKNSLLTGIRQYIDDVRHHGLLLKYYALWMPVNAMLFTIVPTHWRITVMAAVSFFWMIILSTISSRSRE